MTTADIIRLRMTAQGLASTRFNAAADVVSWLGAVQAQEYAMAKWAIGLRANLNDTAIQQAYNNGHILRTHVLRPTWHFVHPADIRWMLALTAPRVHAGNAYMCRQMELDSSLLRKSGELMVKSLEGGKQLTRDALQVALARNRIEAKGVRLGLLLMYAELEGLICSGARQGNQFTYALLEERVAATTPVSAEEALALLVSRFFASRGPATLHDFAYWSGLTLSDSRKGLDMVKYQFEPVTSGQETYYLDRHAINDSSGKNISFLMPDYDEYGMSYKDKSFLLPPADQRGPLLYDRMLIHRGKIIGSWKRMLAKNEVQLYLQFTGSPRQAVVKDMYGAAKRFAGFLGMKLKVVI